jgi:hypothetical protein
MAHCHSIMRITVPGESTGSTRFCGGWVVTPEELTRNSYTRYPVGIFRKDSRRTPPLRTGLWPACGHTILTGPPTNRLYGVHELQIPLPLCNIYTASHQRARLPTATTIITPLSAQRANVPSKPTTTLLNVRRTLGVNDVGRAEPGSSSM